jgi:hypothetical protein
MQPWLEAVYRLFGTTRQFQLHGSVNKIGNVHDNQTLRRVPLLPWRSSKY